jgi:hypothetical protein
MNLPFWAVLFFSEVFNGSQVSFLDKNWHKFSQISLDSSSREELLAQARIILDTNNI